jgi:hypothetical protein
MSGVDSVAAAAGLSKLQERYASLGSSEFHPHALNLVRISVESRDFGAAEIEKEVDAFEKSEKGWARRQSAIYRTPDAKSRKNAGPLLQGEWAIAERNSFLGRLFGRGRGGPERGGVSVHIMHIGGGCWRKTEFTEGHGEEALALDIDVEANPPSDRRDNRAAGGDGEPVLRYRLYFRADDAAEGDIRPCFVRFCGFFERSP